MIKPLEVNDCGVIRQKDIEMSSLCQAMMTFIKLHLYILIHSTQRLYLSFMLAGTKTFIHLLIDSNITPHAICEVYAV